MLRHSLRLVLTLTAMMGWRLEHLSLAWVLGGLGSLALSRYLISTADPALILPYFALTLVFYYGGNTALLLSSWPARASWRWGEEAAFRRYETVLGLMFLNQGLGVGCVAALHEPAVESLVPRAAVVAAGVALFAVGLVVKLWATLTVGVDIYYYRDMFLGRPVAPVSAAGPYRFIRNPMYSLGQASGYGYALLEGSFPALCAAAAGHALIYLFYFVAERPFMKRVYGPVECLPQEAPEPFPR